jgi:hypothetical protein
MGVNRAVDIGERYRSRCAKVQPFAVPNLATTVGHRSDLAAR